MTKTLDLDTLADVALAMARTLTLTAYADACDAYQEGRWRAGGGQDWDDTVPDGAQLDTLDCALQVLCFIGWEEVLADLEAFVKASGWDAEEYGHFLAMEALGHGVSRTDNASDDYQPMFRVPLVDAPHCAGPEDFEADYDEGTWTTNAAAAVEGMSAA